MSKKIFLGMGVIVVIFITIFFINRNPRDIKLTLVKESFNLLSKKNQTDQISISLYVNQKDTYITNLQTISKTYISDEEKNNILLVNVQKVNYQGETKIEQDVYFVYQFDINLQYQFELEIPKAYLILNYFNSKVIEVEIGSFCLYKTEVFGSNDLSVNNLKGVVNQIAGKKTLVGIVVGLKNNTNESITITNLTPLDVNLISQDYKNISNENIVSNQQIDSILGYDYRHDDKPKQEIEFEVVNQAVYLFSLSYLKYYEITNFGLKIDYLINSEQKTLYFDDFIFFNNYERIAYTSELTFYIFEYD
jgi:hypothetical protein